MAFADSAEQEAAVELLQRSLDRGRLGHAYLFQGADLGRLEAVAATLAKTLNCENPRRLRPGGPAVDCCGSCLSCRKIDSANHPDVYWLRPESKLRVIRIDQIRELLQVIYLKPTQAPLKVAVLVAADRLNVQAANAFLKTLEEPPADSILILLTTEPQQLLETILSRCLRLTFGGESPRHHEPAFRSWLAQFAGLAAAEQRSLLGRYRLLSLLLARLAELKEATEETLTRQSPLETHDDIDSRLKERWEDELAAAVEADYRRQRAELLAGLEWWLRDVWLECLGLGRDLLTFPELADAAASVSRRLSPRQAMENLACVEQTQRLLASNVQEALALEVGLLRLHF